MKIKYIFALALLILPLSGCGILSIGYNYAEAYLRYSINSYISYNEVQKEAIKKEVNEYMTWHRHAMLPAYASFLQELQLFAQSGAPLKKADASKYRAEVRALYIKTILPVINPAAKLMSAVDAEQVDELALSFARENKKQRDKELSGNQDEQLRKRAERTIDFIENLTGGLNDGQLERIRELNRQLPYATPLYIVQREDNQGRLVELLKNHGTEADIAAVLKAWLYTPEASRSAEERSTMQAFESGSDEMIVTIYQMLTERQKKTLLKNIAKYINTFQELASAK
jgi:hypothetical protein